MWPADGPGLRALRRNRRALAGSTLAVAFWQIGIRVRGPGATSVLFNLVPVAALLIAAGFGRMPAVPQLLAVAIAVGGVIWASRGARR